MFSNTSQKYRTNICQYMIFLVILSLTPVSRAALVTIDFDDLSAGVDVGVAYAALGVTFQNAEVTTLNGGRPGATAPNTVFHSVDGGVIDPSDPIIAVFAAAVSSVSVAGFDVGTDGIVLNAFDATSGGSLVDFAQSAGGGDNLVLTVSGQNILRVEFSKLANDFPGDGVTFDNFAFTPVPLPAAFPLFLGGLFTLSCMSRRRTQPALHT